MSSHNSLTCRLAFLGGDAEELSFLEKLSAQVAAPASYVFSTKQLREYRGFACDYCVLSPAAASAEVVRALVADACASPSDPRLIIILLKQHTARLERGFEGMAKPPQIILMEKPDPVRAAELINSFFILEQRLSPPEDGWEFVGASAPVHELYKSIRSFARWGKDPVLIHGETGTGKELVARRLHQIRGIGEFRAYNAAAIPLTLAASEIFGHVKGAYTDAKTRRDGYIIAAKDGTLFIDEIGETELALQVMLLRVLQERKVVRLGDDESRAVHTNARFVFATNRDLEEACREGRFREDLLHRISALRIEVKPLRRRKADIPLLVDHFVREFARDYEGEADGIGTDNLLKLDVLFDYEWTGNVRELRNVVRQAAALTGAGAIDSVLAKLVGEKRRAADEGRSRSLPSRGGERFEKLGAFANSLLTGYWPSAKDRLEKAYDQALYLETKGESKEMADRAGIKRTTAYKIKNKLESSFFTPADLTGAAGLAAKLKEGADPVSKYLRGQFSSQTKQLLSAYGGGEVGAPLLKALVGELNRRLQDFGLYQPELFQHVSLSADTQSLLSEEKSFTDLFRLNRMLIEDAYPDEIRKCPAAPGAPPPPVEARDPDEDAD